MICYPQKTNVFCLKIELKPTAGFCLHVAMNLSFLNECHLKKSLHVYIPPNNKDCVHTMPDTLKTVKKVKDGLLVHTKTAHYLLANFESGNKGRFVIQ